MQKRAEAEPGKRMDAMEVLLDDMERVGQSRGGAGHGRAKAVPGQSKHRAEPGPTRQFQGRPSLRWKIGRCKGRIGARAGRESAKLGKSKKVKDIATCQEGACQS